MNANRPKPQPLTWFGHSLAVGFFVWSLIYFGLRLGLGFGHEGPWVLSCGLTGLAAWRWIRLEEEAFRARFMAWATEYA